MLASAIGPAVPEPARRAEVKRLTALYTEARRQPGPVPDPRGAGPLAAKPRLRQQLRSASPR